MSATIKVKATCFSSKQVSFPCRFGTTPSYPLSQTKGQSSSKHLVHHVNQVPLKDGKHLAYQISYDYSYDSRPFHSPSFEPFSTSITRHAWPCFGCLRVTRPPGSPSGRTRQKKQNGSERIRFFFPGGLFPPKQTIYCVNTSSDTTYGTPGLSVDWLVMFSPAPSGLQTTNNKRRYLLLRLPRWTCSFPCSPYTLYWSLLWIKKESGDGFETHGMHLFAGEL